MRGESPEPLARKLTHRVESVYQRDVDTSALPHSISGAPTAVKDTRAMDALKQLFCGGLAGSVAKTITAPLSRLTILYQGNFYCKISLQLIPNESHLTSYPSPTYAVHPMVTTKENRPKFSMTLKGGISKIVERGGVLSLWKGNGTSVLHRFPFSGKSLYLTHHPSL
jgi:hypothetical protein